MERIAKWLRDDYTIEELANIMVRHLEKNAEKLHALQQALLQPIPTDPTAAQAMYILLDEHQYLVVALHEEAEALVDKAKLIALPACGTSTLCRDESGTLVPGTGCKVKEGEEGFYPKYKELTETDRRVQMDSSVAAFRRFRGELKALKEALTGRVFNMKGMDRGRFGGE